MPPARDDGSSAAAVRNRLLASRMAGPGSRTPRAPSHGCNRSTETRLRGNARSLVPGQRRECGYARRSRVPGDALEQDRGNAFRRGHRPIRMSAGGTSGIGGQVRAARLLRRAVLRPQAAM